MPDRLFTLDEAAAELTRLRPIAERMVELRAAHRDAAERRAALRETIAGNGGNLATTEVAALDAELEQLAAALAACVEQIDAAGVQVKDLDLGLLDFPALRNGVEILLCWRVGEDGIAWWHGLDEGLAGRKPIDFVE